MLLFQNFSQKKKNVKTPEQGDTYSINECYQNYWYPTVSEYIHELKSEHSYDMRYTGTLTADFHRILQYGGVYLYPSDKKQKTGKLKIIYQCIPLAYLMQKAGGKSINNSLQQDILTQKIDDISARTGFIIGSAFEIDTYIEISHKEQQTDQQNDQEQHQQLIKLQYDEIVKQTVQQADLINTMTIDKKNQNQNKIEKCLKINDENDKPKIITQEFSFKPPQNKKLNLTERSTNKKLHFLAVKKIQQSPIKSHKNYLKNHQNESLIQDKDTIQLDSDFEINNQNSENLDSKKQENDSKFILPRISTNKLNLQEKPKKLKKFKIHLSSKNNNNNSFNKQNVLNSMVSPKLKNLQEKDQFYKTEALNKNYQSVENERYKYKPKKDLNSKSGYNYNKDKNNFNKNQLEKLENINLFQQNPANQLNTSVSDLKLLKKSSYNIDENQENIIKKQKSQIEKQESEEKLYITLKKSQKQKSQKQLKLEETNNINNNNSNSNIIELTNNNLAHKISNSNRKSKTSQIKEIYESVNIIEKAPSLKKFRKTKKTQKINFIDSKLEKKELLLNNKIQNYLNWIQLVNHSNNITVPFINKQNYPNNKFQPYKVLVGKGNNSQAIKNCVRQRWWMQLVESKDEQNISLVWTQLRLQDAFKNMPSLLEQNYRFYEDEKQSQNQTQLENKEKIEKYNLEVPKHLSIYDKNSHSSKSIILKIITRDELRKKPENKKNLAKLRNIWIIKPGETTNQGHGITVHQELANIESIIKNQSTFKGKPRTWIIQQYIDNPLLFNKRKFDIRCYMLITSVNGILKGYWYEDGYLRTSCKEFSLKNLNNKYIHLTNDAVQKKNEDYGKFENANKVSFQEFQRYLDQNEPEKKINFQKQCYPVMKKIAKDCVRAVAAKVDPSRKQFSFEIFGLDFMIDENVNVQLLEVNTNPAITICCSLLSKIIPQLIENTFRIAIDPILTPPVLEDWPVNKKFQSPDNLLENNKFELIFNEFYEGKKLQQIMSTVQNQLSYDQIYQIQEEEENEEEEQDEDENEEQYNQQQEEPQSQIEIKQGIEKYTDKNNINNQSNLISEKLQQINLPENQLLKNQSQDKVTNTYNKSDQSSTKSSQQDNLNKSRTEN
ncbi:hypothetical protein PPERSA_10798 [Pseudocohnilembus persalinus]|uniref:Fructose-1-6-bisphosphatase class 1 C-terminal domain-containing protein n=1 Tax=Pseudocohnilembus persalinus TaxID=266149 RepID=A0A0V0QDP9_PSEPJ|nr:hypothetical protein PPERSA_10798 [Pseudocohnilembus persalinus]|eukprot:KRX00299.1 hypothetical protein PPERSA_10798 [Pseudocohnilembus persalinus]